MRSSELMPGNPWPHDMQITVEDRPNALLELLWIREAYELEPVGVDLPPTLSDTPAVVHDAVLTDETRLAWESAWSRVWAAVLAHAAKEHDPQLFAELHKTVPGSTERVEMLHAVVGPTGREEFGDEPFDTASYREWSRRGVDAHRAKRPRQLDDHPERRDLTALIPAWKKGLTRIVTIPCRGSYTRKIGVNALLVTDETRDDSDAYRHALGAFV